MRTTRTVNRECAYHRIWLCVESGCGWVGNDDPDGVCPRCGGSVYRDVGHIVVVDEVHRPDEGKWWRFWEYREYEVMILTLKGIDALGDGPYRREIWRTR